MWRFIGLLNSQSCLFYFFQIITKILRTSQSAWKSRQQLVNRTPLGHYFSLYISRVLRFDWLLYILIEYQIPMGCSTDGRSIENSPFDRNFPILVDALSIERNESYESVRFPTSNYYRVKLFHMFARLLHFITYLRVLKRDTLVSSNYTSCNIL